MTQYSITVTSSNDPNSKFAGLRASGCEGGKGGGLVTHWKETSRTKS